MSSNNSERESRNLLDRLFEEVRSFHHAKEVRALFDYCIRMRNLSSYNAALVYTQQPGNQLVLSAKQWGNEQRLIKPNARPLIILLPFGPVGFVYDIADTLPECNTEEEFEKQRLIDKYLNHPFQSEQNDLFGYKDSKYILARNMPLYGIVTESMNRGSSMAANIRYYDKANVQIPIKKDHTVNYHSLYWVGINNDLDEAQQLASLFHELGHLFCHHLPTPLKKYKQRALGTKSEEFEAESVSYLVCSRLGIKTRSAEYLAGYKDDDKIPHVSFENIFHAVNTIENMLKSKLSYKEGYLYKFDEEFKKYVDAILRDDKIK